MYVCLHSGSVYASVLNCDSIVGGRYRRQAAPPEIEFRGRSRPPPTEPTDAYMVEVK